MSVDTPKPKGREEMSWTKLKTVPKPWAQERGSDAWWRHVSQCDSCAKYYEIPAEARERLKLADGR